MRTRDKKLSELFINHYINGLINIEFGDDKNPKKFNLHEFTLYKDAIYYIESNKATGSNYYIIMNYLLTTHYVDKIYRNHKLDLLLGK